MNFPTELIKLLSISPDLVTINEDHEDGRVNSILDEETVITLLEEKYGDNVERPKAVSSLMYVCLVILFKSSHHLQGASDNFSSSAHPFGSNHAFRRRSDEESVVGEVRIIPSSIRRNEDNNRDYISSL